MTRAILFDASRLLSRTDRSSPTGIDRVCLAYAEWLMAHPHYVMVPVRARKGQLAQVDDSWFRQRIIELRQRWDGDDSAHIAPLQAALFAALQSPRRPDTSVITTPPQETVSKPVRMRAFKQFFRSRRVSQIPPALAYINVGHTGLDDPSLLQAIKAQGIARILLIHDLIPVTHPEYCRAGDDAKHHRRMVHALTLGTHLIANSAYTRDQINLFADQQGLAGLPVDVAHLGIENQLSTQPALATTRPYFVHVGTIEARKNLAFLLSVWRRLEETMGDDTPSLVLAGRYGWENEAVLDHLQRSPNLRGLVHQISGLSDAALSSLMLGARAVIAPSSVEGFDLPAVEARTLGVPLLASDIPPHRELVPDARLIDPLDGPEWCRALIDFSRQKPKVAPYNPPSWAEHFEIVEREVVSPLARTATHS